MELHHYLVRLALPQYSECIFEMIENLNPKLEIIDHSINACSETQCLVKAEHEDMSRTTLSGSGVTANCVTCSSEETKDC